MLFGDRAGQTLTVKNGPGVSYTVPQKIRREGVKKSCSIYFRVNRVCRDSEILVTSGETVIAKYSRSHLAPGEMEHIVLPGVLLNKAEGEISLSVREA